MDKIKDETLFCPRCGKRLPVVVVQHEGKTVLKIYCKRCHAESVFDLKR